MKKQFEQYRFSEETLYEMNAFKIDLMENRITKETSKNNGPDYRNNGLLNDHQFYMNHLWCNEDDIMLDL